MKNSPEDPVVRRAVESLRQLPVEDATAVRRIVVAAVAAGLPRSDAPQFATGNRRARRVWILIGVAAAALIGGFIAHPMILLGRRGASSAANMIAGGIVPIHAVSNTGDATLVPHQFVFERQGARRVSLVGDFNAWDARSAPMERAVNGVWSAVILVLPGRHVYGFIVDDTLFRLDPRVPASRDPDLGTAQSVTLVGRQ